MGAARPADDEHFTVRRKPPSSRPAPALSANKPVTLAGRAGLSRLPAGHGCGRFRTVKRRRFGWRVGVGAGAMSDSREHRKPAFFPTRFRRGRTTAARFTAPGDLGRVNAGGEIEFMAARFAGETARLRIEWAN